MDRRHGGDPLDKRQVFYTVGFAGLIWLFLWLTMLQISEAPVFRFMSESLEAGEEQRLFFAAVSLVALNTVRGIPLYLGCFYLGEQLGRYGKLFPIVMIPLSYDLVALVSGERSHHFGMPAILSIGIVLLLLLLIRNVRGRFNRSVTLSLFVFSFQWLNMPPVLTRYGFGRGELSLAIKNLADLSGLSHALDFMSLGGFAVAFIGALMATALLVNVDLNAQQFRRLMKQNEALAGLREEALRARMTREIQSLVHDLRRPLTSIQGLADVLASFSEELDTRVFAGKIAADAEHMDHMVSEILYENGRSQVDARELLNYAMSQASPFPWHRYVQTEFEEDETTETLQFDGNRIRISRALVNLMENAAHAVQETETPKIVVNYFAEDGCVKFSVRDNGTGVRDGISIGSSGHGSTGLGLAVAQSVAENHGGSFVLRNCPGGGAEAVLSLPLVWGGR